MNQKIMTIAILATALLACLVVGLTSNQTTISGEVTNILSVRDAVENSWYVTIADSVTIRSDENLGVSVGDNITLTYNPTKPLDYVSINDTRAYEMKRLDFNGLYGALLITFLSVIGARQLGVWCADAYLRRKK